MDLTAGTADLTRAVADVAGTDTERTVAVRRPAWCTTGRCLDLHYVVMPILPG